MFLGDQLEERDAFAFGGGFGPRGGVVRLGAFGGKGGGGFGGAGGFGGGGGGAMLNRALAADGVPAAPMAAATARLPESGAAAARSVKVREFFPETMLWQPGLITDDNGVADLAVNFADSITTWRLSASANALGGALGGITFPLKVFQDFFVDIDLPVSLTQRDEVAFPVAVYNYLKTPQTVKVVLEQEPWFDLIDAGGLTRTLELQPNEVTSVKFRIRAGKIGNQALTVKAYGSKKNDAVKRAIEVVPNGERLEKDRQRSTPGKNGANYRHPRCRAGRRFEAVRPALSRRPCPGHGRNGRNDADARRSNT